MTVLPWTPEAIGGSWTLDLSGFDDSPVAVEDRVAGEAAQHGIRSVHLGFDRPPEGRCGHHGAIVNQMQWMKGRY